MGKDYKLASHIESKIKKDKYSPEVIISEIKVKGLKFDTTICINPLYNYIDNEIFMSISNKDLPVKK